MCQTILVHLPHFAVEIQAVRAIVADVADIADGFTYTMQSRE